MKYALVFDLDGTLVDTAPDLMMAHNYVMEKYGFRKKPLEDIRYLAGRGAAQMLIKSLDSQGRLISKNEIDNNLHQKMTEDFINFYKENINKSSQLNKNVLPLLKWSKENNILNAVCTNKREDLTLKLLKEINLDSLFDFVAGADTFDYRKPDPRHLTSILDILGIEKNNSIMIGDSETDSETAKNANIKFILVEGGYTEKDYNSIFHNYYINDFIKIKDIVIKEFKI
jgi:phosphoglycolate phosphatase